MPAIQTTYTAKHAVAYDGMIADITPETVVSRTVEGAAIAFGRAVSQGAADYGIVAAQTTPTKFVGFAVRDQAQPGSSVDSYAVGATAGVLTEGAIWLKPYEIVAAGDPVYFVTATGAIGKTAASSTLVPNARWETSAAANGLAIVRIK